MAAIKISTKNKIEIEFILAILSIVGYYLVIYKSFGYRSNNEVVGILMINFSVFILSLFYFNFTEATKNGERLYIGFMVVLVITLTIIIQVNKRRYVENQLNKFGTNVTARVINFEVEHQRRRKRKYVVFEYYFENKKYTQRIEDYDKKFQLQQALKIRISRKNPEMFSLS